MIIYVLASDGLRQVPIRSTNKEAKLMAWNIIAKLPRNDQAQLILKEAYHARNTFKREKTVCFEPFWWRKHSVLQEKFWTPAG